MLESKPPVPLVSPSAEGSALRKSPPECFNIERKIGLSATCTWHLVEKLSLEKGKQRAPNVTGSDLFTALDPGRLVPENSGAMKPTLGPVLS